MTAPSVWSGVTKHANSLSGSLELASIGTAGPALTAESVNCGGSDASDGSCRAPWTKRANGHFMPCLQS